MKDQRILWKEIDEALKIIDECFVAEVSVITKEVRDVKVHETGGCAGMGKEITVSFKCVSELD